MPKPSQADDHCTAPPISADGNDSAPDHGAAKEDGRDGPPKPLDSYTAGGFQAHAGHNVPRHRLLSPVEWSTVASCIGGISDAEEGRPVRPNGSWWPPSGMPVGFYRDVVVQRTKFFYMLHGIGILRWVLMALQMLIGATLTSLGAMSMSNGTPITILGAANTVIAGFLAMLHNSGLPERYRHDMMQFEELEDHIKELLDGGIALADQALDQVIAECFDSFRAAKATVNANLPAAYNSQKALQGERQADIVVPAPPVPPLPRTSTVLKASDKANSRGDEAPKKSSA